MAEGASLFGDEGVIGVCLSGGSASGIFSGLPWKGALFSFTVSFYFFTLKKMFLPHVRRDFFPFFV